MVRRIVGVLVETGRRGLAPAAVSALLSDEAGIPARLTAPASGLFLERVYYPGDSRLTTWAPATALWSIPDSSATPSKSQARA
jgi:tRNA U38,U39,U40 pseudouridine synthase TruA